MATKSKKDSLVETAILAPLDWVDERTAAVRGTKWFLFRNVPRDISWAQTLGSAESTITFPMPAGLPTGSIWLQAVLPENPGYATTNALRVTVE